MQEIIATGKTTEEAVEKACAELGLSRDEVTIEIIDMPQRRLFGSTPAKVRVSALEESFSVKDLLADAAKPQPVKQEQKPAKSKPERKQESRAAEESHAAAAVEQNKPQPEQAAPQQPEQPEEQEEEIALDSLTGSAAASLEYLRGLARGLGAEKLEYRAVRTERGIKFVLDGEDASLIIGRRGETMDAIQYLCTLVGSRCDENYCKISLDVANYRKKRENTLRALAAKEAAKVKKTKYSQTLEPMNPYERRIVHSAVQEIEGVKSESIGVEPNRRVVISLISGGKQGGRGRGGRGRRDNGRRYDDRRRRDNRQENEPPRKTSAQIADEYKPVNNVPLYGKIEF